MPGRGALSWWGRLDGPALETVRVVPGDADVRFAAVGDAMLVLRVLAPLGPVDSADGTVLWVGGGCACWADSYYVSLGSGGDAP